MTSPLGTAIFDVLDVTGNWQLEQEALKCSIELGCEVVSLLEACDRIMMKGILHEEAAALRLAEAIKAHHGKAKASPHD